MAVMTAAYEVLPDLAVNGNEWHDRRTKSIGASDVAAILGLSPWQTPLDIYRAKKGVRHEIDANAAYFGHALEPVIAQWITDTHPEVGPVGVGFSARSKAWPWLTAAPDRSVHIVTDAHDGLVPVELKSSSAWSKASWAEGVPLYYAAQVQTQLAVLGAPHGWLAVLHGGNSPELYRIERDDEFINDVLIPETRKFWFEHVEAGVPPEPVTSAEAASIWPGDADADPVEADDETLQVWRDYLASRASVKAAEATERALALAVQYRMKDATVLRRDGQVLATWKPQAGARRLDATALRKDHPDLADAYTKQGAETRVFRPKETKEKAA